MQTYENKGAEIYTNGSAGHMNGTELNKMKEVAFEKNPSEPMVYLILCLYTHTHTHDSSNANLRYDILLLNCGPLSFVGGHSESERQTKVHRGQNIAWWHDPQTR